MLFLYWASPSPQNCTRTSPNVRTPPQPLPTLAGSWASSSSHIPIHIPPSQFSFKRIKPSLRLWGSSFLMDILNSIIPSLTSLLQLLWLSGSKEIHFLLSNCAVSGTKKGHRHALSFSSWPKYGLQKHVAAIKGNYNFLEPCKDSIGLIVLVLSIWLSDTEFSLKIINCFTELMQTYDLSF